MSKGVGLSDTGPDSCLIKVFNRDFTLFLPGVLSSAGIKLLLAHDRKQFLDCLASWHIESTIRHLPSASSSETEESKLRPFLKVCLLGSSVMMRDRGWSKWGGGQVLAALGRGEHRGSHDNGSWGRVRSGVRERDSLATLGSDDVIPRMSRYFTASKGVCLSSSPASVFTHRENSNSLSTWPNKQFSKFSIQIKCYSYHRQA